MGEPATAKRANAFRTVEDRGVPVGARCPRQQCSVGTSEWHGAAHQRRFAGNSLLLDANIVRRLLREKDC
jgi:hypothetical protein